MKLLVTGSAGFIGSNFVHYMLEKYKDITLLTYDKLTYAGNLDNLKGADPKRHIFIKGDITNKNNLLITAKSFKPDAVVHFAAESHVDRSIDDPQAFLSTNILGTDTVLRVVKELHIKKLVHISTDEVYGSLPSDEASESFPFKTNSPYSASKASGDLLCQAYFKTYDTPVSIIRGSNCYGPRQYPEKLIPLSLIRLFNGKKIPLYGSGENIREWIYTEDFCAGVESVLNKGKPGEAYNLGGGAENRIDNYKIACGLISAVGSGKPADNIEYVADRLGHDQRYALNSSKLKKIGWSPKHNLASALKKTAEWYQNNEWWWSPLLKT
jgi:dTDP-glucose 4,6-dehydratase